MWAHEMAAQDYQDLIDRGWRRSGKYCYKPSMSIMCCPSYTIKCAVADFQLSKSQKKVLKNFAKYVATGVKPRSNESPAESGSQGDLSLPSPSEAIPAVVEREDGGGDAAMKSASASVENLAVGSNSSHAHDDNSVGAPPKKSPTKGVGADPTKPKAVKAKLLRKEKKLAKMTAEQKEEMKPPSVPVDNAGKTVEDFIESILNISDPKVKFEVKLIKSNPPSEEFEKTFDESFGVYKKYQMVIHNDDEDKLSVRQVWNLECIEYHGYEPRDVAVGDSCGMHVNCLEFCSSCSLFPSLSAATVQTILVSLAHPLRGKR